VSALIDRNERSKSFKDFVDKPVKSALVLVGWLATVGFFLGILVHRLCEIQIGVEGLHLWQACGIVAALCWVLHMFLDK
jgi:hypothetical protein